MLITLVERIVERQTDPTKKNYKKVLSMRAEKIEVYESSVTPRMGETIVTSSGNIYDVVSVAYSTEKQPFCLSNILGALVEIKPHIPARTITLDGCEITEDWPSIATLFKGD